MKITQRFLSLILGTTRGKRDLLRKSMRKKVSLDVSPHLKGDFLFFSNLQIKKQKNNVTVMFIPLICYKLSVRNLTLDCVTKSPILGINRSILCRTVILYLSKRKMGLLTDVTHPIGQIVGPLTRSQAIRLREQETFIHFCKTISQLSIDDLQKDATIIKALQELLIHKPILYNKTLQLILSVAFYKRKFSEEQLRLIYKDQFEIADITKQNDGIVDISTVYTCLQTYYLKTLTPFKDCVYTVISTPTTPLTIDELPPNIYQRIIYTRSVTRNSFNDVDINGIPHDFKCPGKINYARNHIYMATPDDVSADYFLKKVLEQIEAENKKITVDMHTRTYYETLFKKYKALLLENSNVVVDKNSLWDSALQSVMHVRAPNAKVPLLIRTCRTSPVISNTARSVSISDSSLSNKEEITHTISDFAHASGDDVAKKLEVVTNGVIKYDPSVKNNLPHIDLSADDLI